MLDKEICGCCDDSMNKLCAKPLAVQIAGARLLNSPYVAGLINILQSNGLDDLDKDGLDVVEWCMDFLFIYSQIQLWNMERNKCTRTFTPSELAAFEYKSLWNFVQEFLQIPMNSGYDYYIMSYLDWNGLTEHGGGIRCSWLCNDTRYCNKDYVYIREVSEDRVQQMYDAFIAATEAQG